MDNHRRMRQLVLEMSGQGSTITVPKVYVRATGNINAGIILNQIIFWSDKGGRDDGFFYKTHEEFAEETLTSTATVKRALDRFIELGLLEKRVLKVGGFPTTHLRLNLQATMEWVMDACGIAVELPEIPVGEFKLEREPSPEKSSKAKDGFEEFWQAYPKKEGKKRSLREWLTGRLYRNKDEILKALEAHKALWEKEERGRKFMPNPSTWLHGEQWNDVLGVKPKQSSSRPKMTTEEFMEKVV